MQNVPDTFSDTPELPDTLPDTVLDMFDDFSKSYTRLQAIEAKAKETLAAAEEEAKAVQEAKREQELDELDERIQALEKVPETKGRRKTGKGKTDKDKK